MIEVNLEDVFIRVAPDDPAQPVSEQRVVLLREADGERLLPIWMGAAEGNALAFRLTGGAPPRPLTSDLMVDLLRVTVTVGLRDRFGPPRGAWRSRDLGGAIAVLA